MDQPAVDDRAIIRALRLSVEEIAMLCDRFENEGIPLHGELMATEREAVSTSHSGRTWRVDIKALAEKLTRSDPDQRKALNRAIARFWEHYPAEDPGAAMRAAGFLD